MLQFTCFLPTNCLASFTKHKFCKYSKTLNLFSFWATLIVMSASERNRCFLWLYFVLVTDKKHYFYPSQNIYHPFFGITAIRFNLACLVCITAHLNIIWTLLGILDWYSQSFATSCCKSSCIVEGSFYLHFWWCILGLIVIYHVEITGLNDW